MTLHGAGCALQGCGDDELNRILLDLAHMTCRTLPPPQKNHHNASALYPIKIQHNKNCHDDLGEVKFSTVRNDVGDKNQQVCLF